MFLCIIKKISSQCKLDPWLSDYLFEHRYHNAIRELSMIEINIYQLILYRMVGSAERGSNTSVMTSR